MYFFNFNLVQSSIKKIIEGKVSSDVLEQLTHLDKSFDPRPWPYEVWMKPSGHEAIFILSEGLEILGLAVFRLSFEEGLAHLLKFLIIPDRRREGLGELVLSKAMEILKGRKLDKVYLEVEKGNPAFFLYQKLGLKKIHEIVDFYGPDRPGLVMMSGH